ncbi:MAG: ABC transporter ATP-binding protein [Anaerolineales bacterium]|jgi:ATP-binding cassette subfamily B protein
MTTATAKPGSTRTSKTEERASQPAPERKDDTMQIIARILDYMVGQDNKRRFAIAMVVRIIGLLGLIATPYLTGEAINVISLPGGTQNQLVIYSVLAILATLIYTALSTISDREFANLATIGLYRLQTGLFNHMQGLSLSFFDRQPLGQLLSRVTNDAEAVAQFYEQAVAQIIRSLAQIVLVMILMVIISWQLTIAALVVVPIILLATVVVERVSSPAFEKMQEDLGAISGFQEETISGNKVVIANRRHEWANQANLQYANQVFEVANKAFFASLLQFPITNALVLAQVVVVLFVGGFMVIYGETTLGTVTAFMAYAALLATPLSNIANLISTTLAAVAGGRRIFQILDEQPTVVDTPDAADYEFKGGLVVFEDVDFSYVPGRKILKHNTFAADPGEMVGICGPTGAGKSTIINILTRYYDIDSGRILIDGQDISKLRQVSLRQQIGVVLQEAFLFTDTVMNNLKYARAGATEEECIAAAKQANAHEFIMNLPQGYDTVMTERGANLSQGQRQMITIARAMVANPKMLILDEATSNVDTRTEKLIQEGMQKLMEGKTSFSIAHRLATIRGAHKILVVNGGEIEEEGPHDELMAKKGFYYTLYMSQFKGKAPGGAEAGTSDFAAT